jgi:hypothetical protein
MLSLGVYTYTNLKNVKIETPIKGANRITQATPTYFLTTFVIAFREIFLEYSWIILEKAFNFFLKILIFFHNILLRFMLKYWQKM